MIRTLFTALAFGACCASTSVAQNWVDMAQMPGQGRHHPVTFSIDGFGYVVTGSTTSQGWTDDFFRYDPDANDWTVLPDFPGPDRGYAYGGAWGGKGYLGFGAGPGYFRDLWEYDPTTEAWTQLADCPGTPRTHPAFVVTDDGKIYVGCGGSAGGNLNDWWVYEIATDSWTQLAPLPGVRRHHPYYFNVGDVPYVGFGHGAGIFRDFYRYNPGTADWTRMTDFPGEQRVAGTQFTANGVGYILSGEGVDHRQFDEGEFWQYNDADDTWTRLNDHPGSGRWAPGTFVIDNTVYFLGGLSTTRLENDMMSALLLDPADVELPVRLVTDVRAFPNPIDGVHFRLLDPNAQVDTESLRLLSPSGRVIPGLTQSGVQLQLPSGLSAGRYFLSYQNENLGPQSVEITVLR